MMLKHLAFAVAALALVACAGSSNEDDNTASATGEVNGTAPITLANWVTHPKIVAVRKEVSAIDAAKLPVTTKKDVCGENGVGEFQRDKAVDAKGIIREYVDSIGDEDGAEIISSYYDAKGTLRFVFRTENDVHGNSSEYRIYFDETGKRIWAVTREASDPKGMNPNIKNAPYQEMAPDALDLDPNEANPEAMFESAPSCN